MRRAWRGSRLITNMERRFATTYMAALHSRFLRVALGKLGSRELQLRFRHRSRFHLFRRRNDAGSGERDKVSNREYFIKLAEAISKLVGQPAGESPAYRVDLRLRPHGRDGALACSLAEALKYYDLTAQAWNGRLDRSRRGGGL